MKEQVVIHPNLIDMLGFSLTKYSATNGEVHGFDELTESEFTLPVSEILSVIEPHIRAAMGTAKDDIINIVGHVKGRHVHFSEQEIRGYLTKDMEGKSLRELRKLNFIGDQQLINVNRLIDGITKKEITSLIGHVPDIQGSLVEIKTMVMPIDNLRLAFFSTKVP